MTVATIGLFLTLTVGMAMGFRNVFSRLEDRVKFLLQQKYDMDQNGVVDYNDFECMAVRKTVIDTRGDWDENVDKTNLGIMTEYWNELAWRADYNLDGEVTPEEFLKVIVTENQGLTYTNLRPAIKFFINDLFKKIDADGDGKISLEEYRVDCVNRMGYNNLKDLDAPYSRLFMDDFDLGSEHEGITLARYQDLYVQFIQQFPNNQDYKTFSCT